MSDIFFFGDVLGHSFFFLAMFLLQLVRMLFG